MGPTGGDIGLEKLMFLGEPGGEVGEVDSCVLVTADGCGELGDLDGAHRLPSML